MRSRSSRHRATDGPLDVRVFATDIDRARSPSPAAACTHRRRSRTSRRTCERYFTKSDGGYEVVKSLRSLMIFGEHDLGARAPFPRIDLILCRNVLIYFNLPMQRAALETFGFSLRDDGRLVLGPSETVRPAGRVRRGSRPVPGLSARAGRHRCC